VDEIDLAHDQGLYIQAIFDYLEEHGDWPTFKEIDRHLYRNGGLDAKEIAESLGPLVFGSGYMPWSQPDVKLPLPLRLVAQCSDSNRLVELVVATVDLAVKTELKSDDSAITSRQLQDGWHISDHDLLRLGRLLLAESSLWEGSFAGPDESGVWSMGIGRSIRRFRDVNSIEQLLAALPSFRTKSAVNPARRPIQQSVSAGETGAPVEISESLARFRRDHPDPTRTAFIMMRFVKTDAHEQIVTALKVALQSQGLIGLRADDAEYHPHLFLNITTYMHGCGLGIAVFERIETDDFNPNVALEVGYMLALKKDVCLLKDRTLKSLHADLFGMLYRDFDTQHIQDTIAHGLTGWLRDKGYTAAT
jgi:hypothetical protein